MNALTGRDTPHSLWIVQEIYDWYADYYGEHTLEVFFGDGSPKSQRRYGHGVRTGI